MRVSDRYGGPGNEQAPGDGRDRSDPRAFRRGRQVGQIVRGRLVAPGPGGLFWVVVAGHKLLASLDHEPVPGVELVFRIERLDPDLVLRDITPPPSSRSDPALLLAALTDARSRFEHFLPGFPFPPGGILDLTAARRRFAAFLAAVPEAGAAYERTRSLFRLAAGFLAAGEGRPLYAPWVHPGLTQSELLAAPIRNGNVRGFALRLFGRLPGAGRILAEAWWRPGDAFCRLTAEHPQAAEDIMAGFSRVRFGRAEITPRRTPCARLPEALAGGLLAPLLARTARPFTGLRLRV